MSPLVVDRHSYAFYKERETSTSESLQKQFREAFSVGDWCKMEHLLSIGALINYRYDEDGQTLLSNCNTREAIIKLMELGADVNAKDKNGESVLYKAIYQNWSNNLVKTLLKYGAQVNVQGRAGCLLVVALRSQNKNLPLIKLLLEHHANLDGVDKYDTNKPLRNAMWNRDYMKLLIKYGVLQNADTYCKDFLSTEQERSYIPGYDEMNHHLQACVEENVLMKKTILNNRLSLYDYLYKKYNNGAQVYNIDIREFPIYGDIIQKVVSRKILLNKLLIYVPSEPGPIQLNYDCKLKIAAYLDIEDIQNVIEAFVSRKYLLRNLNRVCVYAPSDTTKLRLYT